MNGNPQAYVMTAINAKRAKLTSIETLLLAIAACDKASGGVGYELKAVLFITGPERRQEVLGVLGRMLQKGKLDRREGRYYGTELAAQSFKELSAIPSF